MKKIFVLILMVILCSATSMAAVSFGLRLAYFSPSDPDFRTIYGGGGMFGGDALFSLSKSLDLWLDAGYFGKTGGLSYTLEETKLTLVPIGVGLRYRILPGKVVPYVGAGVRYIFYGEKNLLGEINSGGVGFVGKAGLTVALSDHFGLDIQAAYSTCKMQPADFEFNVGGFEFGAGLVYSF